MRIKMKIRQDVAVVSKQRRPCRPLALTNVNFHEGLVHMRCYACKNLMGLFRFRRSWRIFPRAVRFLLPGTREKVQKPVSSKLQ